MDIWKNNIDMRDYYKVLKTAISVTAALLLLGMDVNGEEKRPPQADASLVTPKINVHPSAKYQVRNLDYGMTIGIERTPKGRIWCCWVGGGDDERAYFLLAYSDDDGWTWSRTKVVIDPHDSKLNQARRTIAGTLWTDPAGRLWLFFDQSMTYFDGRNGDWFTICENPDSNHPEWSEPKRIWHGCTLNKPTVVTNGDWILPVSLWGRDLIKDPSRKDAPDSPYKECYHELDSLRGANVFISKDKGKSWNRQGIVRFPKPHFDEHHITELKDGRLWMTGRTHNGIFQSFSSDEGKTWTKPEKYLPNNSSRHFIRRLSSGNLLLVKNGKIDGRTKSRSDLTAYISTDDGKTWKGGLQLDERNWVSYPDGFQAPDGYIFISYDWERAKEGQILLAKFTEQDIIAGKVVSDDSFLKHIIIKPGKIHKKK